MKKSILLEAQQISFHVNNRQILEDVSFQLAKGQCLAILGHSGVGKSTLLKILAGHLNADKGRVLYRGIPLIDPREQLIRGHKEIKLVNQDFELEMFHNVEENLRIKLPGYTNEIKNQLIQEVLEITELESFAKNEVRFLSGGEQQRLALARAIIQEPDVLLLDEPFVHLDANLKTKIEKYIQNKIRSWQGGLILVTHDGREAMSWADKIIYIKDGKINRIDTPFNFYHNPNNLHEALHFGPINTVQVNGLQKMFRPNAYEIREQAPYMLKKISEKFVGVHYESQMRSQNNEDILLYSQRELPNKVAIEPRYVGEK